jgi:hypothetical protein
MSFAEKCAVAQGLWLKWPARHGSQRPAVPNPIFSMWNAQILLPVNSLEPEPDLIENFVRPLNAAGIRYLIVGFIGSMHYSEPRLTLDFESPYRQSVNP